MSTVGTPSDAFIRKQGRYLALRNVVVFLVLLALAGILCLQTYLAIIDNERIEQNENIQAKILEQAKINESLAEDAGAIGRDVKLTQRRLLSCTDPGGKCYRQSQKRTGAVVASLSEVTVLASGCAAGVPPTLPEAQRVALTRACVEEQLLPQPDGMTP